MKGRGTYLKVPTPPHQGTYPSSRSGQGVPQGTYPCGQGTYPPSQSGQDGGGTPRYQLPTPSRSGWGRGYPKVPTHPPAKVPTPTGEGGGRSTPRYLPPPPPAKVPSPPPPGIGQHVEYLIRWGRYASCVHAGGLLCCNAIKQWNSVVLLCGQMDRSMDRQIHALENLIYLVYS